MPFFKNTTSIVSAVALAAAPLVTTSCSTSPEPKAPSIGVAYQPTTRTEVTVVAHEVSVAQGKGRRAGGHLGGALGGLAGSVGGGFVGGVVGSFFGSELGRKGITKKVSQYTIRTDAGKVIALFQDDLPGHIRVGQRAILATNPSEGTSKLLPVGSTGSS